jgi:hypothetical protein
MAPCGAIQRQIIGMLESWNVGKMGFGILRYWVNGKIHLDDLI